VFCLRPDEPWEGNVTEAPFVVRREGVYYLLYSGNSFDSPRYAVGYATANSPLGPWRKFDGNPILKATDQVSGPGHCCLTTSPDRRELFIVYHRHRKPTRQEPRERVLAIDRVSFVRGPHGELQLKVHGPTHTPQPRPRPRPGPD
jgi:GH43 family beta-xylosidase